MRLGCLGLLRADRLERQSVDREGEPQRGLAFEHERHAPRRFDQLGGVHHGVVVDRLGEQPLDRREVALDQQRGHGLLVGAERDQLAVVAADDRDRDGAAVAEGLADLGQGARRDSAVWFRLPMSPRSPSRSREPRPGSGRSRRGTGVLSPTSSWTPVITGVTSSRDAATATCATASANSSAGSDPGALGDLGKGRILLDRHAQQREVRRSAADGDLAVVGRELHGRVRQSARDVGEQPAGDQGACPVLRPRRRSRSARRDLVVERRQDQHAVGGLEQNAAQDGQGGALGQKLDGE